MKKIFKNKATIVVMFCILMLISKYINFLTGKIKDFDYFIGSVELVFIFYIIFNKKLIKVNVQNAGVVFIISIIVVFIIYHHILSNIIQNSSVLLFLGENLGYLTISIAALYLYFRDNNLKNQKEIDGFNDNNDENIEVN